MARVLVIGAGIFGSLAAAELRARGHEVRIEHRPAVDADHEASVVDAARGVDAMLHTAGPFQRRTEAAARAAASLAIPYVDLSDERAFSQRVAAVDARSPILTGMSTAPALAEALVTLARRRGRGGEGGREGSCAMYLGSATRQGPASIAFGVGSRAEGPSIVVDFPGIGRKRAFPARAAFAGAFFVAVGGLGGIAWRFPPVLRLLAPIAAGLPRPGWDKAGALVARVGDRSEAVYAIDRAQRIAILPAIFALEEALAGRTPRRAAQPHAWVDPEALLAFLQASGIQRVSA